MKILPISPAAQINIHNVKIIGDTRTDRLLDISRRHYFSEELVLIFQTSTGRNIFFRTS